MAVIRCKMCGGDLQLISGSSVSECQYCGSMQTVPEADDERKLNLFARADRLRAECDFDKASVIYESIVADYPREAEAYWGLVLCKYGIEYVDDPGTGEKKPTCHRSSYDSVLDDNDYDQALSCADSVARRVYREYAQAIEEIRNKIVSISKTEKPYDIFICYKETAEDGDRTIDSVLAQKVYDQLTDRGYRVFFSRISLEDKLGKEYEPYIFAALQSARIMLVFGSKKEYFQAVWVRNEWSRYLKLMARDSEKVLIPCFKTMDAYDLPKEFRSLQAQNMDKIGADQDLLRGIEKILPSKKAMQTQQTVSGVSVENLLERANIMVRDGDFKKAYKQYERVLDHSPHEASAYWGMMLCNLQCNGIAYTGTAAGKLMTERRELQNISEDKLVQEIDRILGSEYRNACRYADPDSLAAYEKFRSELQQLCLGCLKRIREDEKKREEEARIQAEKRRIEEERRVFQEQEELFRAEEHKRILAAQQERDRKIQSVKNTGKKFLFTLYSLVLEIVLMFAVILLCAAFQNNLVGLAIVTVVAILHVIPVSLLARKGGAERIVNVILGIGSAILMIFLIALMGSTLSDGGMNGGIAFLVSLGIQIVVFVISRKICKKICRIY